jgi:hypothetical protein
MSGLKKQSETAEAKRGVLCAMCEHLNPLGRSTCEFCKAHLYLACSRCGSRNARVQSRCSQCNRELHRSILSRIWHAPLGRQRRMTILQAVLLVLAIITGLALIVFFAELRLPGL